MGDCLRYTGQGQTLGSSWRHVATTGNTQGRVFQGVGGGSLAKTKTQ